MQANINGSGNDYNWATDITDGTGSTTDMLDEINYTQAVDTLILCHEDLQTKRLIRNSDTSWTLENLPLKNVPQYAYALTTHSPTFTIHTIWRYGQHYYYSKWRNNGHRRSTRWFSKHNYLEVR